jgi:hypothetical protein
MITKPRISPAIIELGLIQENKTMARQKKTAKPEDDLASFTLPSDEKERKKIRDIFYEMAGIQQLIKDRKEDLKGYIEALNGTYGIPKKIIPQVAKIVFDHNYDEVSEKNAAIELCYEGIMQSRDTSAQADVDDEAE